jgi:phosphoglycerate dehydrogenase-like enzyme
VWYRYPDLNNPRVRPSACAFDSLPNVVMTPHLSAWTDQVLEHRALEIAHNLTALASGEPLGGLVRRVATEVSA